MLQRGLLGCIATGTFLPGFVLGELNRLRLQESCSNVRYGLHMD